MCTEVCEVPKYGDNGYIKVKSSGKVMSLKGGDTKKGTEVILEDKLAASDYKQDWTRSRPTSDGYFTLQNAATAGSDLYLVSTKDGKLTNGVAEGEGFQVPPDTPKGTYYNIIHYDPLMMSKKEAPRKHPWK